MKTILLSMTITISILLVILALTMLIDILVEYPVIYVTFGGVFVAAVFYSVYNVVKSLRASEEKNREISESIGRVKYHEIVSNILESKSKEKVSELKEDKVLSENITK